MAVAIAEKVIRCILWPVRFRKKGWAWKRL